MTAFHSSKNEKILGTTTNVSYTSSFLFTGVLLGSVII